MHARYPAAFALVIRMPTAAPFRAIVERPDSFRGLLFPSTLVLVGYLVLLLIALAVPTRPRPVPERPRSSLVVTLLDAPQRDAPRALGTAGSAPGGPRALDPQGESASGPKQRVRGVPTTRGARRESQATTRRALLPDHRRGAAQPRQSERELLTGSHVATDSSSPRAEASAPLGGAAEGAAGNPGSSVGTGAGSGSGAGTSGAGSGTGSKPGVASGDTEVLPFRDGMTRPRLLSKVDPSYSREARDANVEGLILTKCVITTRGLLERCRVVKGIPLMDRAVLSALTKWRYSPVIYQGRAVAVEYVIPVRLVLP